jgi:tRNA threonylcarbamoyladenosine modification (KEOPS) complex Cgi121 subunit
MALTQSDKNEIKTIIKSELRDFLNTNQTQVEIIKIVKKEMGARDINEKVVELAAKVVSELFKTMWQRKSFWEDTIKKVR